MSRKTIDDSPPGHRYFEDKSGNLKACDVCDNVVDVNPYNTDEWCWTKSFYREGEKLYYHMGCHAAKLSDCLCEICGLPMYKTDIAWKLVADKVFSGHRTCFEVEIVSNQ